MAGENYTLIGPRGFWPGSDAYEDMREATMKWYTAMDVAEYGLSEIIEDTVKRVSDGTDTVWLSFDSDVMEPAYCPSTSEPEPGRLVPREVIAMVYDAVTQFNPENFGFNVVEVAPQYDVSDTNSYKGGITSRFANRLIIEVMGSMALAERGAIEGSPIKPKEPLGLQPDLEVSADY